MTLFTKAFGSLASLGVLSGAMFLGTPKAQAFQLVVVARPIYTPAVVVTPAPVVTYTMPVYAPAPTYVAAPAPVCAAPAPVVVVAPPAYCPPPVVYRPYDHRRYEGRFDRDRDRDHREGFRFSLGFGR